MLYHNKEYSRAVGLNVVGGTVDVANIPLLSEALLSKLDRKRPKSEWLFWGFLQVVGHFQKRHLHLLSELAPS